MDCNAKDDGVVKADPDVAGLGVLVSFMVSASLILTAMILGYCTRTTPSGATNLLDEWMLAHLQKKLARSKGVHSERSDRDTGADKSDLQSRIVDSLQRLMAALSDQQLVTGPALLIAGYAKHQSLAIYHFDIIASVAWFTAGVHWVSLMTLQTYFIRRLYTYYWRLVWIMLFLVFLIISQFLIIADISYSYAVTCVFRGYAGFDPRSTLAAVITVILLIDLYVDATLRILLHDLDWRWSMWLVGVTVDAILRFQNGNPSSNPVSSPIKAGNHVSPRVEEVIELSEGEEQKRYLVYATWLSNSSANRLMLRLKLWAILNAELGQSFLSDILSAIGIYVYGIASTFWARKSDGLVIEGDQNAMGFGQIVPLLLLLLPAFTAYDIFQEKYTDQIASGEIHGRTESHSCHTVDHERVSVTSDASNNAPQDVQKVSKSVAESAAGSVDYLDITRLGELARMIDSCLLSASAQSSSLSDKDVASGKTGISRMSTGIALQQAHGYHSFQMTKEDHQRDDDYPVGCTTSGVSEWQIKAEKAVFSRANTSLAKMSSKINTGRILLVLAVLRLAITVSISLALSGVWGDRAAFIATYIVITFIAVRIVVVFPFRVMRDLKSKKIRLEGSDTGQTERPQHLEVSFAWLQSFKTA